MDEIKFYATMIVDEPQTLEIVLHNGDADTVCEDCGESCEGQPTITTTEHPYDYQSAYTTHLRCTDWQFITNIRPTP